MSRFLAGQRWAYKTRTQDQGSTLVIGKIQKRLLRSTIYHVQVQGLVAAHTPEPAMIGHMPLSEKALEASVTELVRSGVTLDATFDEGFALWQKHRGGVFEMPVREAIDAIYSAMPKPLQDGFDELVREMRAQRSHELIEELYRRVLGLPEWYFLCDPQEERAPVEWSFPESQNTTPAVLAFTSRERAIAAAKAIGIYPPGMEIHLMSPTVPQAIEWISGPRFVNTWLCFNLTQERFPFYVDDAVQRFNAQ